MADKKISQLTALSAANLAPSTDVLAIVDTSATETKKIVAQDLINGVLNVASAVGIGTASPGRKLDVVAANNTAIRALSGASGSYVSYGVGRTTEEAYISVAATANNFITGSAAGDLTINNNAGNVLITAGGSATQLYLNTSGNLGLGVTPAAWRSSDKAIQVNTYTALGSNTAGDTQLMNNMYFNSVGTAIYLNTNFASRYEQYQGKHAWYTAASGTINTAISFTQAMTLDADGDLAIGATSASDRLHVERNWNGSTWIKTVNTDSGAGAAAGMLFKNNTGDLGAISLLSSANSPADSLFLRSLSTNPLVFGTNNTERGRFTAGGYFKASNSGTYVSSTDPYHELRKDQDNSNPVVRIQAQQTTATNQNAIDIHLNGDPNNSTNYFIYGYGGGGPTQRFTMRSNGGLANYQTNDANLSDERTKKDIAPLGSMWDKFKAIEIVTFKYKDQTHDDNNIGVIAQQVESVAPEFVDADGWGETPEDGVPLKSIYTADMYHAAIKALQEAMARIELLEADMAALKGAK